MLCFQVHDKTTEEKQTATWFFERAFSQGQKNAAVLPCVESSNVFHNWFYFAGYESSVFLEKLQCG